MTDPIQIEKKKNKNIQMAITDSKVSIQQKEKNNLVFHFTNRDPINISIERLKEQVNKNLWSGQLAFIGFKGTFKYEYWSTFEEVLRTLPIINKISFIDTQLDDEHLNLLGSLLQWVRPRLLDLKFNHNELDDLDVEDFVIEKILKGGIHLNKLLFISNPGIYKGSFTNKLKHVIKQLNTKSQGFQYYILKNKLFNSLAIFRAPNEETRLKEEQLLQKKLQHTFYFRLKLNQCLNERNQEVFQYLIEQSYDEEKLEQLEKLDICNCSLGSPSVFEQLCSQIAQSKGLLYFGIAGQKYLENIEMMQQLMGDRYDKFRITELDWSNNSEWSEKSFKILAENILSNSVKKMNWNGSMNEQINTLVKIIYLIEAFTKRIEILRQGIRKRKQIQILSLVNYIPTLELNDLDMSQVQTFTRNDLVKSLLLCTLYTEFSNVKTYKFQAMDKNRMKAHIEAQSKFEYLITQKQIEMPKLYSNYRRRILTFNLEDQYSYTVEALKYSEFILKIFFTKQTNIVQVENINFKQCFSNSGQLEGFQLAMIQLKELKNDPDIKYTLQNITFSEVGLQQQQLSAIFEAILFNQQFQLTGFHLLNDYFEGNFNEFMILSDKMLQTINQPWSLKHFELTNLYNLTIDYFQIIDLLVFNTKVQLQSLKIYQVNAILVQESLEKVQSKANHTTSFSLETFYFGAFVNQEAIINNQSLELLVFNNYSKITDLSLSLNCFQVKQFIGEIKVKKLTLNQINDMPTNHWEQLADLLIFGNYQLEYLEFISLNITYLIVDGLNNTLSKRLASLKENQEEFNKAKNHLKELIFSSCTFEVEILSLFLRNNLCKIQKLHIKDSYDITPMIEQTMKVFQDENSLSTLTASIKDFSLNKSMIIDDNLYILFLRDIVFYREKQQVQFLDLEQSHLTDQVMEGLNKIIAELKLYQKEKGLRIMQFQLQLGYLSKAMEISIKQIIVIYQFFKHLFSQYDSKLNENEDLQINDQEDNENQQLNTISPEEKKDQNVLKNEENLDQDTSSQDKLHILTEDLKNYVNKTELNILEVLPQFKMETPMQLRSLQLSLNFSENTDEQKFYIYQRILKGLVFFPSSQLEFLKLSFVNLELFMKATKIANEWNSKFTLKKIKLSNITSETQINVKEFLDFYFNEQLEYLFLKDISNTDALIFQQIINKVEELTIQRGNSLQLETLKLPEIQAHLNALDTMKFFKLIIFNNKLPLKNLKLYNQIELLIPQDFNDQLKDLRSTLIKFSQKGYYYSEEQCKTFEKFIPLLIRTSDIERLTIKGESNSAGRFFDGLEDLKRFKLKKLKLDYPITLDAQHLGFFYKLNLTTLILTKINNEEFSKEFFVNCNQQQLQEKCDLEITFTGNTGLVNEIYKYFIFGKIFTWNSVKLNQASDSFVFLKEVNFDENINLQKLKILNFSFGLANNLNFSYDIDVFKILGDRLIYNENSVLEQLLFMECNLEPKYINAMTTSAAPFREKMIQSHSQKTLSLKKIAVYSSQFLLEEGAKELFEQIIFFEYITIEKIQLNIIEMNDQMAIDLAAAGKKWIQFQRDQNRPCQGKFMIQSLDIGINMLIQGRIAWNELCQTFIFSLLTPHLNQLNIPFIGIRDDQIRYICDQSELFFNTNKKLILPLQRLNFYYNQSLTSKGWRMISEKLFFHSNIDLQELNLLQTMLDEDQKILAIYEPALKKASNRANKKLPLHTLICGNNRIKTLLQDIISDRPSDFIVSQLEDKTDINMGKIQVVPQSFGQITQLTTQAIQTQKDVIIREVWKQESDTRFPYLHIHFVDGFLKPANQVIHKFDGELNIDYKVIDQLLSFFIYKQHAPGDPYPVRAFFNQRAYEFYLSKESKIKIINFISTQLGNLEQAKIQHIIEIWENVKSSKTSIDQIRLEWEMDDDFVDQMIEKGYTERDFISLIRIIPPKKIKCQETLTLNAIKGIYSIYWDHYQFDYADFLYDKNNAFNVGIGFALREGLYETTPLNVCVRFFKKILYKFMNIFVSQPQQYIFSEQIKNLNNYLADQNTSFVLLAISTLVFYIVCMLLPWIYQKFQEGEKDLDEICKKGIAASANYTYLVYACIKKNKYYFISVFSFILEGYLFYRVSQLIPDHIKGIIELKEEKDENLENLDNLPNKVHPGEDDEERQNLNDPINNTTIINRPKKKSKSQMFIAIMTKNLNNFAKSKTGRFIGYAKEVILGQLNKFDFFNDIRFIMIANYCQFDSIALAALIVTLINVAIQAYYFLEILIKRCIRSSSRNKKISTNFINDFFDLSLIGRNTALAQTLDNVAPFNVSVIPNNIFSRTLMPTLAGKSISNSVKVLSKTYLVKFLIEDVPQIILQLIFIFKMGLRDPKSLTAGIYITIINSGISLLTSFIKFMSIRPSLVTQNQFDELADRKAKLYMETKLVAVEKSKQLIEAISENYSKLQSI